MEKQIEVFGILTGRDDTSVKYLCISSVPPRFPGRHVLDDETLRDSVDVCFSELGLDTSDLQKRPVRMIDVPRRNLTYVFLLECELSDLLVFLESTGNEDLVLLEKDNLLGESRTWVEELERKIEGKN